MIIRSVRAGSRPSNSPQCSPNASIPSVRRVCTWPCRFAAEHARAPGDREHLPSLQPARSSCVLSSLRPARGTPSPPSTTLFGTIPVPYPRLTERAEARSFCTEFYAWYNREPHSGIGMHTPLNVQHGRAPAIQHARARVLTTALYQAPRTLRSEAPAATDVPNDDLDQRTRKGRNELNDHLRKLTHKG